MKDSDKTKEQLISELAELHKRLANRQRRQARLGFLSPVTYDKRFYAGLLAA